MSRIASRFAALHAAGRKALIPFITAGDPEPGATVSLMHTMVTSGADILEIGIPFSDPMAEGPVIQRACERALSHGTRPHDVLEMVREFRRRDDETPVVLMGYLNPIETMGYQRFAGAAHAVGVDGVIVVDLPPDDAADYTAALHGAGIDTIFLASPTSPDARIRLLARQARGFVYYVSLKGVTGADTLAPEAVRERVGHIESLVDLPVVVGFGIRDAATAALLSGIADGVVVGSRLVQIIAENIDCPERIRPEIAEVIEAMRAAIDAAGHARS